MNCNTTHYRANSSSVPGDPTAERYSDKLDQQGKHYLDRVRAGTQRMGQLIDDLLHLSRVSRAEARFEDVDLAMAAREVAEDLKRRDPTRKVAVEVQSPLAAHGDPRLLKIVLENLLANAWKFTRTTENARITVAREETREGPVYYVADNGVGFDMQYASKLFAPFQRLHDAKQFEGSGIGLATVHRIIQRHGGRIWAESSPGMGATFRFTLRAP